MPLYEYACADCGSRVEARHGLNEPAPARCLTCGGRLERVFTVPGGSTRRPWNPWGPTSPSAPARG